MTTYICAYAFICFIYELYVDETEKHYETPIENGIFSVSPHVIFSAYEIIQ